MRKSELPITEISLKDFLKLDLWGYERRKHYYDEKGRRIDDTKAFVLVPEEVVDGVTIKEHYHPAYKYSKLSWDQVNLVEKVKAEIDFIKCEKIVEEHTICLAIHIEPDESYVKAINVDHLVDTATGKPLTSLQKFDVKHSMALDEYSYLDKYLTKEGSQTYLLATGITKLYSTRDYYECRDEYFRIPKKETSAIYLIKY